MQQEQQEYVVRTLKPQRVSLEQTDRYRSLVWTQIYIVIVIVIVLGVNGP